MFEKFEGTFPSSDFKYLMKSVMYLQLCLLHVSAFHIVHLLLDIDYATVWTVSSSPNN
jgi:hypothetical protein